MKLFNLKTLFLPKNLGRLWLPYTELQGGFYMLLLTLGTLRSGNVACHDTIRYHKEYGHLWIERALHSLCETFICVLLAD